MPTSNQLMTVSDLKELARELLRHEDRIRKNAEAIADSSGIPFEDARIIARSRRFMPVQDQHPRLMDIVSDAVYSDQTDPVFRKDLQRWLITSTNGQLQRLLDKLAA